MYFHQIIHETFLSALCRFEIASRVSHVCLSFGSLALIIILGEHVRSFVNIRVNVVIR